LEEAIVLLNRAIALSPEFAEAYRNLGHALTAAQQHAEAVKAYRRAVELGTDAYLGLAKALREQGLVDEAIAAFRKVNAIGGREANVFHSLGTLLTAKHRDAEAIEVYEQWLQWDPDSPVARHMLAACRQESVPSRASDAYVEAVFDGFAPAFDRHLRNLEYRAPELVVELLKRHLGDDPAKLRILDAGCGTGLCGPLLRPFASELTGVDLSGGMLELAERGGAYDHLAKAELTAFLDDAMDRFDVIVSADTLVYFGDLRAVLLAASRALTIGGCLIATLERADYEDGPGYRLNQHGRYSHSEVYLRTVCDECGSRLRTMETKVLRQELGQPVPGLVVCATADVDRSEKEC
jgi:predicted TPR repeat methyltransferase